MKPSEISSGTSNSAVAFTSSNSWRSNSNAKYGGLIENKWSSVLKKELFSLFSYSFSVSPKFYEIHNIVFIFRIFQFLGPTLCANFPKLWAFGSIDHKSAKYLSILAYYSVSEYNISLAKTILAVYSTVFLISGIIIYYSARFFQQKAMLPKSLSLGIVLFIITCGNLLHPVAMSIVFSSFAQLYFSRIYDILLISISVATLIITLIFIYIQITIINQSIQFIPSSMMSISSYPENCMIISTLFINAIFGFASQSPKSAQLIFLVIAILCYAISFLIPFIYGGFVKSWTNVAVLSSSSLGIINSLLLLFFVYYSKTLSLVYVFEVIMGYLFFRILMTFILGVIINSRLDILDQISENNESFFSLIKSPNHFANVTVTGTSIAHPVCINWAIFKFAIEKWPQNNQIWLIFAKFVAIFPEQSQKLMWIFQTIITTKVRGIGARTIKNEAMSIVRQREVNLSSTLKEKLNSISNHIQSSKMKLRRGWDVVIQGNLSEVEASFLRANEAIERVDTEINHLLQQYPNNKFVTRLYSRFLLELKGDHSRANEMTEKTRILHRGGMVNTDKSHELGLSALYLLPERILDGPNNKSSFNADIAPLSIPDMEPDEDSSAIIDDQSSMIHQRIKELSIPSVSQARFCQSVYFFGLLLISVGFIIFINQLFIQFREPLPFIYDIANLRTFTFQMATFGHRYVYQKLGYLSISNRANGSPPKSLGYSWDLKEQLEYIIGSSTSSIQSINNFRSYYGDGLINEARSTIFGKNVNFYYYTTSDNQTMQYIDLQQAAINIVVQLSNLLEANTTYEKSIINTSIILNPIRNVGTVTNFMNNALTGLINSIHKSGLEIMEICYYIDIISSIFVTILCFLCLYIQIRSISLNKIEVCKSMTALPKNIVSNIVENMRMIKHDESGSSSVRDSDMNRQEENILKILSSGNTGSENSSDSYGIIIGTIAYSACFLLIAFLLNDITKRERTLFENSAPHLDYITGSYSLTLGTLLSISVLSTQRTDVKLMPFTEEALLVNYRYRSNLSEHYYHMARYGGQKIEELPFAAFAEGLEDATKIVGCPNRMVYPTTLYEISDCFSPDLIVTQIIPGFEARLSPYIDFNISLNPLDRMFTAMFDLLIYPIYDAFLSPMFEQIVPTIEKEMDSLYSKRIVYVYLLMMLGLFILVYVFQQISIADKQIRTVLLMLLHCPPSIIMQTQKIMSILSGDFIERELDTAKRDSDFFDNICYNLPDAVVNIRSDDTIISFSKAFCDSFEISQDIIGATKISDVLNERKVKMSLSEIIQQTQTSVETIVNAKSSNGSDKYYSVNTFVHNEIRIITFRDISQIVRYNALIKEEKLKSDSMLAAILPPSLVKRVQNNEKNISFAVQSASIIFMDIVSFTPWCSSNPASVVMQTLNLMYRKYDALLTKYPTMVKIKCIGDCYMAAGGIFSEANQPSIHAKEVVSFGLDALEAIEELNKETGQSLQIRIGVNTGGPIVGGVLGIGKPTFEILGPAINMAQQMEHHGLPMKVQVSRPVYELIYGDSFAIKERGQVETKQGNVITYLVNRN